jgi:hypothetical protein
VELCAAATRGRVCWLDWLPASDTGLSHHRAPLRFSGQTRAVAVRAADVRVGLDDGVGSHWDVCSGVKSPH